MSQRVVVLGGTGFVGRELVRHLLCVGYVPLVPSRSADKIRAVFGPGPVAAIWDGRSVDPLVPLVDGARAVINLVGENIAEGRWNEHRKNLIFQSRVLAAKAAVKAVEAAAVRPEAYLQASAVGYYGPGLDEVVDEDAPAGRGFLADVCVNWEHASEPLEALGVRRVVLRSAMVLGRGGALARMLPAFRRGLGGALGSGRQAMPWIHMVDEVGAIRFLLEHPEARGPFNLASPEPVSSREFAEALGRGLGRPARFRVPAAVLRLALGQMAEEVLLAGRRAMPKRLLLAGYKFAYPSLKNALANILANLDG